MHTEGEKLTGFSLVLVWIGALAVNLCLWLAFFSVIAMLRGEL